MCRAISAMLFCILLCSCSQGVLNTSISGSPIELSDNPITLKCDPPLSKNRNSAGVIIELDKKWEWVPEGLRLEDGRIAKIDAILIDDQKKEYAANGHFWASGNYSVNFDNLPQNAKIVEIKIKSNLNLICKKVYWHQFDPE